jgi:hypothetical protein
MAVTPIAFGTRRWDVPLNAALADLQDQVDGKFDKAGGALTGGITTNLAERSAFFKTTSATQHAVTIYQASTTGTDVAAALNLISDNRETSAVYISGHETLPRGTVKITHTNGGTDADAEYQARLAAARALIAEDEQRRMKACLADIKAACARHRMSLDIEPARVVLRPLD